MMDEILQKRLIEAALDARERAYAPYSNFSVGASVLTHSDDIFVGANVENASYGLTICAERVAAASAVAAGHRGLHAVAVAAGGHAPCGACRQFLAEFGGSIKVFLVDAERPDRAEATTLTELLPRQFKLEG